MIQEITVADNHVLVNLSGSIYVEEAAQIRESLIGYIEKGHKTFVVDLGSVDLSTVPAWVRLWPSKKERCKTAAA